MSVELLPDTPANIRRRRGLLLGLESLLSHEQALAALCLWERDFADGGSPFSGLQAYTKNVCEEFGKLGRRRDLHAALLDALFQPDERLPPDPTEGMRAMARRFVPRPVAEPAPAPLVVPAAVPAPVPAPVPSAEVPVSPLNLSFSLLLAAIGEELGRRDAPLASLADCLSRLAARAGLPAGTREELERLLCGRLAAMPTALNPEQAATLVHATYVWLAEALGPVAADRCLSAAAQTVERDPRAAAYPVRKLL